MVIPTDAHISVLDTLRIDPNRYVNASVVYVGIRERKMIPRAIDSAKNIPITNGPTTWALADSRFWARWIKRLSGRSMPWH